MKIEETPNKGLFQAIPGDESSRDSSRKEGEDLRGGWLQAEKNREKARGDIEEKRSVLSEDETE